MSEQIFTSDKLSVFKYKSHLYAEIYRGDDVFGNGMWFDETGKHIVDFDGSYFLFREAAEWLRDNGYTGWEDMVHDKTLEAMRENV